MFAAGGSADDSPAALEELCATYWRPIYGFIRRRGHGVDDARDLTQGFLAGFLERRSVKGMDPARGRFRSYLLASVKNFLANEWARERALKRGGGGLRLFSVSGDEDGGLAFDPADTRTPEGDFERQWALALLRRALERLRTGQRLPEPA